MLISEHGHIIRFKVPFDPVDLTSYVLCHHTWEDGAVSGYCRPPGQMVGVQADRYIEPYFPPFAPPGPGVMASFIYAIPANGILQWFRHDGARHGAFEWKGARPVGVGWAGLPSVIPGGGDVIYAITPEGELLWYEHVGFNTGAGLRDAGSWKGRTTVNHDFGQYTRVFSGGNGIIYGITPDGRLIWHRHYGIATGQPVESAGSWAGPKEVGVGWDGLLQGLQRWRRHHLRGQHQWRPALVQPPRSQRRARPERRRLVARGKASGSRLGVVHYAVLQR